MARQADWDLEMRDAMRSEGWSLNGPARIVKVVPLGRPLAPSLKGYVGLEKSLLGKTPSGIGVALGLPAGYLGGGCRVYRLLRLPMANEVEYELTADRPDGLAYHPAMHDPNYPPGSRAVHQWRLLVDLPVQPLIDLAPSDRYPYLHR